MAECYPSARAVINRLVTTFGCSMLVSIEIPTHWAISASSMGFAHIVVCMWARALIHRVPYVPLTISCGFSRSSQLYKQVFGATSPMVEWAWLRQLDVMEQAFVTVRTGRLKNLLVRTGFY